MSESHSLPSRRPPPLERSFSSSAVEDECARVATLVADPVLRWLFINCYPHSLDTTLALGRDDQGRPDTSVITGDIPAMWLRDSAAQLWPYLPLAKRDRALQDVLLGLVYRHAACIRRDLYANAFFADPAQSAKEWRNDRTELKPGVHERKYELDSLAYVLRLARGYVDATGDTSFADDDWKTTLSSILDAITLGRAGTDEPVQPPYRFQRVTLLPSETLADDGQGWPARRCGLSRSPFRPSDDAAQLPFPIAANAMTVVELRHTARWLKKHGLAPQLHARALALAAEIDAGLAQHGCVTHAQHGRVFAYEVDGFGSHLLMDDANIPSLLGLPYLGWIETSNAVYRATRRMILSTANPWWFSGRALSGIGSPHVTEQKSGQTARRRVWPLSLCMQALTAEHDAEILACLKQLRASGANTGFMHESVDCDDVRVYSRPWFAWANALFGELIITLAQQRPHLLAIRF